MKSEEFDKIMDELTYTIKEMSIAARREYAKDHDCLENFNIRAKIEEIEPSMVCLNDMLKHTLGVAKYIKEPLQAQRDSFKGRITDLLLYTILLYANEIERGRTPIHTDGDGLGESVVDNSSPTNEVSIIPGIQFGSEAGPFKDSRWVAGAGIESRKEFQHRDFGREG